jgi:hypothetical protein
MQPSGFFVAQPELLTEFPPLSIAPSFAHLSGAIESGEKAVE